MKYLIQVLMLTVVLFALTSAPAPVDHTEGVGGMIAEMVLTAPVGAHEYAMDEDCDSGCCESWCLKGPRAEPETYGTCCECEPGNGGGNGGGIGGALLLLGDLSPAGTVVYSTAISVLATNDGLLRNRCGGWVVGVALARRPVNRIVS